MFRLKDSGGLRRAGKRGWDAILPLWPILFGIFVAVLSGGCSSGPTNPSSFSLVNAQGSHPANFLSAHQGFVGSTASECRQCHGDDLTGGISNTSCFTASCHHGTVPGWDTPAVHGAAAKRAPGNGGFVSCQICHASDFTGDGSLVSCLNNASCHGAGIQSPHPPQPWRASSGPTHTDTYPVNAPVCAACHFPGSANNPATHPAIPAPSGTAPGCFNNTLCHGDAAAPHVLGPDWLDPAVGAANFHGLTAKQDLEYCQSCHGTSGTIQFNGGAASTSCSASTCHLAAKAHPIPWFEAPQPFPNYVASHRDSGNRNVACAICHKVDGPGAGPDPAAPSCFTDSRNGTTCHVNGPGNAPHDPNRFLDHTSVTQATFTDPYPAGCSDCHAVSGTSPRSAAPTCTTCHGEGATVPITPKSPLTNLDCTSCHDGPSTGPTGTTYPNVAGGHSGHDALNSAGTPVDCDTCHTGLGSGSTGHYDRANARTGKSALRVPPGDAAFGATYAAKSAALGFNNTGLTCAGISCHGGQTTPNWQNGTIDVNFDSGPTPPFSGCRQCHVLGTAQGIPEYNSPFSGLHQKHLEQISASTGGNALCTECHDMANGTTGADRHFLFLSTRDLLEGPASDTIQPDDKDPAVSAGTYDASTQTCNLTCHGTIHDNYSWTGGANHAIPFLDPRHTTMNATNFDGDCGGACHAVSPASPSSSPPTCQTCHQAGSPLTAANCTSCHASPPSSSSTAAYPNVEGGHTEHDSLANVTGNCTVCHTGLTSGSLAHYNRANARTGKNALRVEPGDVSIVSTYFAKPTTSGASFSTTNYTCSNVSCHGGILAPRWDTGTINVNFDSGPGVTPVSGCRQCHTWGTAIGTPQNNSAWSGLHQKHLQGISARPGGNALCTECHDMANGTTGANNHFTNLNTAVMEGPPGQTVRPDDKDPTVGAGTYTASTKTCTGTCHTQIHDGWRWEGPEANHSLGSAWTDPAPGFHGLTAKSDLTDCQSCHSQSGTIAFAGGTAVTSCAACHPAAKAHPTTWFEAPQTGFPPYTASHRNSGNQGVACAVCHDVTEGRTPPDSAAPSCFIASFTNADSIAASCHVGGPGATHPEGWVATSPAAQPHGGSAKGAPSSSAGFGFCRSCHGTTTGNFNGGTAQVSCLNSACHLGGGSSPHPANWLPGNTYVHTTSDEGNASECAFCHFGESGNGNHPPTPPPGGSNPGCFNNTLCHGAGGVPAGTHETGWLDSDSSSFHGASVPTITCETSGCHPISGHPTCTTCHFNASGSRATGGFTHNNPTNNHGGSQRSVGNICENCHETSRTFRAGSPPSCAAGPGSTHPNNDGCHSDPVIDQTLNNPRF